MAITFVDANAATDLQNNADAVATVTKPTGTADDDVLVAFTYLRSNLSFALTQPGGWTEIGNNSSVSGADRYIAFWYKVASSEGASYTWTYPNQGVGDQNIATQVATFRGVNTSDVLDFTYVQATHTDVSNEDTLNPNPPDVTTDNDNAVVITAMGCNSTDLTGWGAPSGMTLTGSETVLGNRNQGVAYEIVGAAGAQTVGVWTNTGVNGNIDSGLFTIALRESAAVSVPGIQVIRNIPGVAF